MQIKPKFNSWGLEQIKELRVNDVVTPITEFVKYEATFKKLWDILLEFNKRQPFEIFIKNISIKCISDKSIISHSLDGKISLIKIKGDIMSYYEIEGSGRIIDQEKIEEKSLYINVYEQPSKIE